MKYCNYLFSNWKIYFLNSIVLFYLFPFVKCNSATNVDNNHAKLKITKPTATTVWKHFQSGWIEFIDSTDEDVQVNLFRGNNSLDSWLSKTGFVYLRVNAEWGSGNNYQIRAINSINDTAFSETFSIDTNIIPFSGKYVANVNGTRFNFNSDGNFDTIHIPSDSMIPTEFVAILNNINDTLNYPSELCTLNIYPNGTANFMGKISQIIYSSQLLDLINSDFFIAEVKHDKDLNIINSGKKSSLRFEMINNDFLIYVTYARHFSYQVKRGYTRFAINEWYDYEDRLLNELLTAYSDSISFIEAQSQWNAVVPLVNESIIFDRYKLLFKKQSKF